MTGPLDIAVCGCGPAGLAAALSLRRGGHRVRIFERFAAPRPVGSGLILQPTGLGVLLELGLFERIAALGMRIERLLGRAVPSNRIVLDVRYSALGVGHCGLAVHRDALFRILLEAALQDGIDIATGTQIAGVACGAKAEAIAAGGKRLGSFDLVVDALGARSPLSSGNVRKRSLAYGALWVNVPWPVQSAFAANALEQRYRRASQMAGLLPIGRRSPEAACEAAFFWSMKRDALPTWRDREMQAWKAEVADLWPQAAALLGAVFDHEQVTFAEYDHFTLSKPYSQRLVHIGDAAHATSPQLGQGANMALLDALALSRALEGSADLPSALQAYARMRRRHVRLFQAASAAFTPFYQSDSRLLPVIRDRFAAPLSRMPFGAALLSRLVAGMTTAPLRGAQFQPKTFAAKVGDEEAKVP
jgi:salicylate hydroxylase